MSRNPLEIQSAHELMSRAMEAAPEAYRTFARAIAAADPGLGADFAWAVSHPAADSLDAAWAESEAALPKGWHIKSVSMDAPPDWQAWAGATPEETREGDAWEAETGPTPAAALRALAAKLRGRAG